MTLRAAIYARVSTPNQTQAQTIEQQVERLKEYANQQDYTVEEQHIFLDDGRSGATLNRPGLDWLRDVIRQAEVDCVLIASPDRLARNYIHQMILLDEAAHYGCLVEFLDRPMSQDPHDKLLLQIRGAVAEYERALITDRMRRGRLAKYQAGILLPWTRPPYGYRLGVDHPRDPCEVRLDEFEAAVVQEVYDLYVNDGVSLCGLAQHLQQQGIPTPSGKGIWGLATLRGILRQPAYTGKVYAMRYHYRPPRVRRSATHEIGTPHSSAVELPPEDWIFVADIPAIISQEVFDLAQDCLARNKSFAARHNTSHPYLLRALVSCGLCQSSCLGRAQEGGRYRYYVCAGKANPIHSRREEKCPSRFAPAQQLDDLVWQDLCAVMTHPEQITDALKRAHSGEWLPQELQARRGTLRQTRSRLEKQLDRLTEAYLAEVIPLAEYRRRRGEMEQNIEGVARQEARLDSQVNRQQELMALVSSVQAFCQRIQTGLANASFEQKRRLVELLVDRVIVTEGDVEIRYVIPTDPKGEYIRFCHLRSDYRYHLHRHRRGLAVPGAGHGPVCPAHCGLVNGCPYASRAG